MRYLPALILLPLLLGLTACGPTAPAVPDPAPRPDPAKKQPGKTTKEKPRKETPEQPPKETPQETPKETPEQPPKEVSEPPAKTVATPTKPTPPLRLTEPAPETTKLDGRDLEKLAPAELIGRANQAMAKEDYARAAAYQAWFVKKAGSGRYNLACFLAREGKIDSAFYWLQAAALEEGVDSRHAVNDEDLDSLRKDKRWGQVRAFLVACNRYFETAPLGRTVLITPQGYKVGTPIPVVVWMHGLGSRPEDFANAGCQELADTTKVAILGVSGTKARGPRSFVWAEDPEKDGARIRAALKENADRVTIKPGQVITFGFSQGAQMGLEIAVRDPATYAGAIVLSPGALPMLDDVTPSPMLSKRGFVLCCGAKEHPGNVRLTAMDADWLKKAKARVIHKPYPDMTAHAFPEDFEERFPEWVRFILNAPKE